MCGIMRRWFCGDTAQLRANPRKLHVLTAGTVREYIANYAKRAFETPIPRWGQNASAGGSPTLGEVAAIGAVAEHWEPYESRGSHTVLRGPGGELPWATHYSTSSHEEIQ